MLGLGEFRFCKHEGLEGLYALISSQPALSYSATATEELGHPTYTHDDSYQNPHEPHRHDTTLLRLLRHKSSTRALAYLKIFEVKGARAIADTKP